MNQLSESPDHNSLPAKINGESAKFEIVLPAELGIKRGAWEMFQNRKILEIYAEYYHWHILEHRDTLAVVKRLPLLGILDAKVFSPESQLDHEWRKITRELDVGHMRVLTNRADPDYQIPPEQEPIYSFIVDLRMDQDKLFSRLEARGRKAINRAKRAGMEIVQTKSREKIGQFHKFMQKVTENGSRYHVPPRRLLEDLILAGYGELHIATLEQNLIGGVYTVSDKYTHGLVSGFDFSATALPSNLLYWSTLLSAKLKGCEFFDLGPQTLVQNPHLSKFKRSFKPYLVPAFLYDYYPSPWRAMTYKALRRAKRIKPFSH